MAKIIRVDGTEEIINPPFSLKYLQSIVGGYIEIIHVDENTRMIINEEGKFKNLQVNTNATELVVRNLFEDDYIVGDVIVIDVSEMDSDDE